MITEIGNLQVEREPKKTDFAESIEDDKGIDIYLGNSEIDYEKISQIEQKIIAKNRIIIKSGTDPLSEISKLSCWNCFLKEAKQNLVDLNLPIKDIFENYQGRLNLKKIEIKQHFPTKNVKPEHSIVFVFDVCSYCGKKISISFLREELNEELYNKLIKEAYRYETEQQSKELDF